MKMRMRIGILAGLVLLGACQKEAAPAAPAEDAPILLKGGQWSLERDMTGYNIPNVTREQYAAKVEQAPNRHTDLCIAVDKQGRPDADALAGDEGRNCTYKDATIRKGRFIATLACKAGGGTSELLLEGNYTPDRLTLGVSMTKSVRGKAVLRTTHDLTGRRGGDCKAG